MKKETLVAIKQKLREVHKIVQQLQKVWDSPQINMCEVLLQNACFNGSDCINYSFDDDVNKLFAIHKTIELLNENSFRDTFIAWLWQEVDCIITGYVMAEDCF